MSHNFMVLELPVPCSFAKNGGTHLVRLVLDPVTSSHKYSSCTCEDKHGPEMMEAMGRDTCAYIRRQLQKALCTGQGYDRTIQEIVGRVTWPDHTKQILRTVLTTSVTSYQRASDQRAAYRTVERDLASKAANRMCHPEMAWALQNLINHVAQNPWLSLAAPGSLSSADLLLQTTQGFVEVAYWERNRLHISTDMRDAVTGALLPLSLLRNKPVWRDAVEHNSTHKTAHPKRRSPQLSCLICNKNIRSEQEHMSSVKHHEAAWNTLNRVHKVLNAPMINKIHKMGGVEKVKVINPYFDPKEVKMSPRLVREVTKSYHGVFSELAVRKVAYELSCTFEQARKCLREELGEPRHG